MIIELPHQTANEGAIDVPQYKRPQSMLLDIPTMQPAEYSKNSTGVTCVTSFVRGLDCCVLIRRAVVLLLLTAWVTMSVVKVQQLLSEPTSTSTHWEEDNLLPHLTICPAATINTTVATIMNKGTEKQKSALLGNKTLLEFFWTAGLKLDDMLHNVVPTDSPGEYRDFFGTSWKASVHYLSGGLCATAKLSSKSDQLWSFIFLKMRPEFMSQGKAFEFLLHEPDTFWGEPLPLAQTYVIMNDTRFASIVITTYRQVRPSLRRSPCVTDPDYNQATCKRHCFFADMNCTLERIHNSEKRLCLAADFGYFKAYRLFKGLLTASESNCSCPVSCVRDRYTISARPGQALFNSDVELHIQPAGIRKVLETSISYTITDLMADIGGFLGLFLGWSLLTLCELAQDGAGWVKARCRRQPKPSKWAHHVLSILL
ncbi:uncharacterized protein LOC122384786 [Amphibalanus amphitrite]|uniref:uncharacterized protein LOC122384786 n=1 Tax=Amphibalanus amphitrite TaxID=1232801 RepID=UPI001C91A920|nr:uncharacterized protein LOC122384786 [Amphibalanus amphitrite]